jgi:hypothetical protein
MAMRLSRKRSKTSTPQTSALSQYARPFVVQRQGQEETVGVAPENGVSLLNNRYQVSATPKYQPGWIARAQAASQPKGLGVQAKLAIGQPNDRYEQEADRVAEQVMGMPDAKPVVQREGLPGEEEELQTKSLGRAIQREVVPEEEEEIQAKPLSATITPLVQREAMPEEEEEVQAKSLGGSIQREAVPEEEEEPIQAKLIQREAMGEEEEEIQAKRSSGGRVEPGGDFESRLGSSKSGGSPLPEDVRSFMEPRFGADFSGVRVHTGGEAVQLNREVGAQAFAHGQDVYFGEGKGPGKDALTAHELTHVVQQTGELKRELIQREEEDKSQVVNFSYDLELPIELKDKKGQTVLTQGADLTLALGTQALYTAKSSKLKFSFGKLKLASVLSAVSETDGGAASTNSKASVSAGASATILSAQITSPGLFLPPGSKLKLDAGLSGTFDSEGGFESKIKPKLVFVVPFTKGEYQKTLELEATPKEVGLKFTVTF